MAIPVEINDIINGHSVEWERVEFKESWNPIKIIQTICAFANDFSNIGGGYLIMGIAEANGRPVLPPKGLTQEQIDLIQKELLNVCKQRITPNYTPFLEPVVFQNKLVLVLWCPGGQERPYEAPESFEPGSPRHYFIRKFSNTVRPTKTERDELLTFASVPFDDRTNYNCSSLDLKLTLIQGYLKEINSKLFSLSGKSEFLDLCRQLNLVDGPVEHLKPRNFALMFFNDHPEQIFKKSQIEIVMFRTIRAGKDMSERIFEGPIHIQLRDALNYFKNNVIEERIHKLDNQAEAIRIFNYPYAAIEEVLANAIYHRSYEITEPVEVRIFPDRMIFINYPGPDPSIKIQDLQSGNVNVRRYRNRQIGNILKELKLTEGRCTGIPTIIDAMESNGNGHPVFETDDSRTFMMVTLPIHSSFLVKNIPLTANSLSISTLDDVNQIIDSILRSSNQSEFNQQTLSSIINDNVSDNVSDIVNDIVSDIVGDTDRTKTKNLLEAAFFKKSREFLLNQIQLRNHPDNFNKYIKPLIAQGWLTMTIPDKPTSKNQEYVITQKGLILYNIIIHHDKPFK
jgi:ATP-dependent DNA helicase RecG